MNHQAGPFQGSLVALPTPFLDGRVDYAGLGRLVELQIEQGTSGLVATGTTGEAAALSTSERLAVISWCVGQVASRVPVIAGVGTSSTRTSAELAREAERVGADGVLVVTPPYNRPSQRGLEVHFGAVADACGLPVVLYNVPSRTGVDLLPVTAARLAGMHENIVAIKEATGSVERLRELSRLEGLDLLCGEDARIVEAMGLGAVGTIGVLGNLLPGAVAELVRVARPEGDPKRAAELRAQLAPLLEALFMESNPGPLKRALELLGWCSGELRPPIVEVSAGHSARLERALELLELIPSRATV